MTKKGKKIQLIPLNLHYSALHSLELLCVHIICEEGEKSGHTYYGYTIWGYIAMQDELCKAARRGCLLFACTCTS